MNRRDFLWHSGGGLGGIALAALLGRDGALGADKRPDGGLHHRPKAKRVVQLFMAGAASHLDLFDFKPELVKRHGRPSDFGEHVEAFQNGLGPWLKPTFDLRGFPTQVSAFGVMKILLEQFAAMIRSLELSHAGVTVINSQGTLVPRPGSWHNELHPSKDGFKVFAKLWHDSLKAAFPTRVL